jgi:hypothetical protein
MPIRFTVLFDTTVTDGSFSCTGFVYYNRRCSGIATMATFNPVDGLVSQLVGDVVRTTWVLAATYIPLASITMVLSLMALHWYWW